MGKFLFQLFGTLMTLFVIGLVAIWLNNNVFNSCSSNTQETSVTYVNTGTDGIQKAVKITKTEPQFDVQQNGQMGMAIAVTYESDGCKGERHYCVVRFYDKDTNPLQWQGGDKQYRFVNGDLSSSAVNVVKHDSETANCTFFMPYDQLPLSNGRTNFYFDVSILDYQSDDNMPLIIASKAYSFHIDTN